MQYRDASACVQVSGRYLDHSGRVADIDADLRHLRPSQPSGRRSAGIPRKRTGHGLNSRQISVASGAQAVHQKRTSKRKRGEDVGALLNNTRGSSWITTACWRDESFQPGELDNDDARAVEIVSSPDEFYRHRIAQ